MKPKLLWLLTGGTFSCEQGENGLEPAKAPHAEKILGAMPHLREKYDITPKRIMNIDSTDMTPCEWGEIAKAVDGSALCFDGIVITHGTDTLAHTAAALYAAVKNPPLPIVLTGSQKPFFEESSDAPKNFADAFAVAADSRFRTVCAVFCGRIFSGVDMTKTDTEGFDAFYAKTAELGFVKEDKAVLTFPGMISRGEYSFNPGVFEAAKSVALIKLHPAFNKALIPIMTDTGVKAFVAEGYGVGGIPQAVLCELEKAAVKGIFTILVTQCQSGRVNMEIYTVGNRARAAGIISGGALTAHAAVMTAAQMLAKGVQDSQIPFA